MFLLRKTVTNNMALGVSTLRTIDPHRAPLCLLAMPKWQWASATTTAAAAVCEQKNETIRLHENMQTETIFVFKPNNRGIYCACIVAWRFCCPIRNSNWIFSLWQCVAHTRHRSNWNFAFARSSSLPPPTSLLHTHTHTSPASVHSFYCVATPRTLCRNMRFLWTAAMFVHKTDFHI